MVTKVILKSQLDIFIAFLFLSIWSIYSDGKILSD